MYRKTRHGIVERVSILSSRWVLLLIGSALAVATVVLVGLWWNERNYLPRPDALYTGCLISSPDDLPYGSCGPLFAAAETAATWYSRSAVVTGILAIGLLAGAAVRKRH